MPYLIGLSLSLSLSVYSRELSGKIRRSGMTKKGSSFFDSLFYLMTYNKPNFLLCARSQHRDSRFGGRSQKCQRVEKRGRNVHRIILITQLTKGKSLTSIRKAFLLRSNLQPEPISVYIFSFSPLFYFSLDCYFAESSGFLSV